jgi:protein subunit release factor B
MNFPPDLPRSFAERAAAVNLRAEDVDEHFILGSGHGGQNRNKRSTAVQLVHRPTGTEVRCFHRRHQLQNRNGAWMQLLEHLEDWKHGVEQELKREEHAERQRTKGRSGTTKKKMVDSKKKRGKVKEARGPIDEEETQ